MFIFATENHVINLPDDRYCYGSPQREAKRMLTRSVLALGIIYMIKAFI